MASRAPLLFAKKALAIRPLSGAFLPSVFDKLTKPVECGIPLERDLVQVPARGPKACLVKLPPSLPATTAGMHETRLLHNAQVLGDGLARDSRADSETRDGQRPLIAQARDQPQTRLVAQRRENWRRGSGITDSAQGAPQSASAPLSSRLRCP